MIYLLFNLYALLDGFTDAMFYSCKGSDSFKWNTHIPLVIKRGLVVVLIYSGMKYNYLDLSLELLSGFLSFSFFHNGMYYEARKMINKKLHLYNWTFNSITSTAEIELNFKQRTILFIISLIGMGIYYIY